MINYPLRSTESHLLSDLSHLLSSLVAVLTCCMANDDCLNYMELPSDLLEEKFAAY